MGNENPDVKTKEASSASSTDAGSQQHSDGIEQSSSSNTNPGNDVKKGQSMSDFVQQTLEQNGKITSKVEDEQGGEEEGESNSENESDKDKKEKTGDEKEEVTGEEEGDEKKDKDGDGEGNEEGEESTDGDDKEKKPVPYDRFQQVIAEKNKATKEVETFKPRAENFDRIANFCRTNQIDAKSFETALEIQALISSGNREEALKRLMPVVDGLRMSTGDSLPADIQAKVDSGKMELEDAKEIAKLRAQTKIGQASSKQMQEQQQRREQEEFGRRCESASNDWEQRKRSSDPDYKPKTKETQPDGKWEDVRDKYLALVNLTDAKGNFVNLVRDEKQMVDLMERAYTQVTAKYQHLTKNRPATRKSLSSNGSSTTSGNKTIEGAKSMQEAISIALKGRI